MATDLLCLSCGAELSVDGICPRCLRQSAIHKDTRAGSAENDASTAPYQGSAWLAPTPAALARHFPQLEVIELLGQGGMGAVYKARQPKLDRLVAVKILPVQVGRDPAEP